MFNSSVPELRAVQHITAAIDTLIKTKNQSDEILYAIEHLKQARKEMNNELETMWQQIGEHEKYIQEHETGD